MILNNVSYVDIDNQFRIAIGQNVTRKPVQEHPNKIIAIIKKDRAKIANNVWARYNEAVKQAQLKLK